MMAELFHFVLETLFDHCGGCFDGDKDAVSKMFGSCTDHNSASGKRFQNSISVKLGIIIISNL